MAYDNLKITVENQICLITIDRADKMNALNRATIQELQEAANEVEQNDDIRGAIITGAGEKAFAAGADISEFTGYDTDQGEKMSRDGHKAFADIEQNDKPFVAAINGFALGGGCELAMACHLRVAAKEAKLGQPEVGLGIIPGYGGTQRLVQLIGKGKAFELLMTGTPVSAEEAETLGLVNAVYSGEELLPKTKELLQKVLGNSPLAVQKIIEAVNAYYDTAENGFDREIQLFGNSFDTEDFKEGTQAFLNKRKPEFKGK